MNEMQTPQYYAATTPERTGDPLGLKAERVQEELLRILRQPPARIAADSTIDFAAVLG